VLKRALLKGRTEIQFAGGSPQDVKILVAHASGLALSAVGEVAQPELVDVVTLQPQRWPAPAFASAAAPER
jgi:hypothetical protein